MEEARATATLFDPHRTEPWVTTMTDLQDYELELDTTPGESSPPKLTPARPTECGSRQWCSSPRPAPPPISPSSGDLVRRRRLRRSRPPRSRRPRRRWAERAKTFPSRRSMPATRSSERSFARSLSILPSSPGLHQWTHPQLHGCRCEPGRRRHAGKHLNVLRPSSPFRIVERDPGTPMWTREATTDMRG